MRAVVYRGVNRTFASKPSPPPHPPPRTSSSRSPCAASAHRHQKIQYGTVPPPRIFDMKPPRNHCELGSGVPALGWKLAIAFAFAPSRAVPALPFLPASRLRPMRDLQTQPASPPDSSLPAAASAEYVRSALRPARRRENSRPQFLRRKAPARNPSNTVLTSRPPTVPCCGAMSSRGPAGAGGPDVHPPAPARRRPRHRHRFDGTPPAASPKIRRQMDNLLPGSRHSSLVTRHPWTGRRSSAVPSDAVCAASPATPARWRTIMLFRPYKTHCAVRSAVRSPKSKIVPVSHFSLQHLALQP